MPGILLDLLRGAGLEPKYVASTGGGEYSSPCPGCGGKDRFRAWPESEGGPLTAKAGVPGTWLCRKCGRKGDVVEYLQQFRGLTWSEAWDHLKVERPAKPVGLPKPPPDAQRQVFAPKTLKTPDALWKDKAAELAARAEAALLDQPKALAWLAARGLPEAAVRAYHLGWVEAEGQLMGICRARKAWGLEDKVRETEDGKRIVKTSLFVPRGILIPAFGPDGEVLRLRVRRPNADVEQWGDKYMVVEGSGMSPLLLGLDTRAVVVVEAELDALAVHHAAGGLAASLAVLTNQGRPDAAAHAVLSRALRILVALDFDAAGADGWAWWERTYPQAKRWPVPEGKDPGDAVKDHGVDLCEWVLAGLPPVMTLGASLSDGAPGRGGEEARQEQAADRTEASPQGPETSAPADLAARLAELQDLLRRTGMVIDRRLGRFLLTHPKGDGHASRTVPWETFGRISDLVFLDREIHETISDNPAPVVTAGNLVRRV